MLLFNANNEKKVIIHNWRNVITEMTFCLSFFCANLHMSQFHSVRHEVLHLSVKARAELSLN